MTDAFLSTADSCVCVSMRYYVTLGILVSESQDDLPKRSVFKNIQYNRSHNIIISLTGGLEACPELKFWREFQERA